ncbi:hypothetical protein Z517_04741 [Fonsecaea pedrosoi CBS 271.37]|uniref:BTB domain-containing protein n=1 Tax=Fonsecaea pedrosoi CBS 271.37 TaxID=1442368 RepID=A0A0D2GT19_9EURO|nr:uncharacterized protein Z517_04741 [Fonsecaea pedrosoi CBS 271.37]KIW81715.1 hypothetical protein Z517_04741 [Fonsecaea pedrosoi CBS 271.37]
MDPRHRGLYVRWCQSPRVKLLVGEDDGTLRGFLIPEEFLQRRSRTLREQITELSRYSATREITLLETGAQTMEEFFIWNFCPNPQLEDRLSFSEVVQLGVFAWKYQVSALSNQVTDMIRHNLANNEWKLEAAIVDAIYQAAPNKSPLREVIKAALGQVPRGYIDGDEWERTYKRNSDFGWDLHKSNDKEWTAKDYLTGSCRFHNHDEIKRRQSLCDGCPYTQEDCYPLWEEDPEQEQDPKVYERPQEAPPNEDYVKEDWNVVPVAENFEEPPKMQASEEMDRLEPVFEDAPEHAPELKVDDVDPVVEANGVAHDSVPVDAIIEDGDGARTPHADTNGVKNHLSHDEVVYESAFGDACSDEGVAAANGVVTVGLEERGAEAVHMEAINGEDHPSPSEKTKKKKKKKKRMSMSFDNDSVNVNEVPVANSVSL